MKTTQHGKNFLFVCFSLFAHGRLHVSQSFYHLKGTKGKVSINFFHFSDRQFSEPRISTATLFRQHITSSNSFFLPKLNKMPDND